MNHAHVSVQMALLLERGGTSFAFVRAIVGVLHALMLFQSVSKWKGCLALVAEEIAFTAMDASYMLVQVSLLQETEHVR